VVLEDAMKKNSIRWRLPLSYATVALVAAIALGSIMLFVLNRYYAQQEMDYLQANAAVFQTTMEKMLEDQESISSIQDAISGLSFLSHSRIQVYDLNNNLLADSGSPEDLHVVYISNSQKSAVGIAISSMADFTSGLVASTENESINETDGNSDLIETYGVFTVMSSPFGYQTVSDNVATVTAFAGNSNDFDKRSSQIVTTELANNLGEVIVSEGPAYGADILHSVTTAWIGASLAAIIIAFLAGLIASRQVTQPLYLLTQATRKMENGDLAARVELRKKENAIEFLELSNTFNQMAYRMQATISTLRAFIADAAHELHTPLTALTTNLELAIDETDHVAKSRFIQNAIGQSSRLVSLVDGLLNLSRVESSDNNVKMDSICLNQKLRAISETYIPIFLKNNLLFENKFPENEIWISTSQNTLDRLIGNLLENAIKFTPACGKISINLTEESGSAKIEITDNGIGIPPDDLPLIFDRFHRGKNSARFPGNGLGLALVKALVDRANGTINVQSELAIGTTFTILLPIS
jgi:signal transduction histidine kinase